MSTRNYGLIRSVDELRERLDSIHGTVFGIDLETGYHGPDMEKFAIHPETAFIVGISFTNSLDWARYVPLAHDEGENLDNRECARLFWDLLVTGLGVAHNFPFELRHLARWFRQHLSDDPERGEAVRASNGYFPIYSDSMVEAYLVAEFQRFGLKFLTEQMFGHSQTELHELFPDLAKNQRKYLRFNTLPLEPHVVDYACEDAVWCLAIHRRYHGQVKDSLLYKVEKAIVQDVVPGMEDEGVVYDWALMRRTADELRAFRDKWNAEIMADFTEHLGEPVAINLASPPQVRKILFERMGLRTTVYTDKTRDLSPEQRVMSTGDIALQKLAKDWPVVKKVLQWREMTKLLGTYLDKYETKFNYAGDGHAHPNHLSAFVITGRFSVSDPPYQGCVPGSYEVLTPDGWCRFDKLADGVPVAQYRDNGLPEGVIEFVTPNEVTRAPYTEDMIEFRSAGGGNWRYTPNHRIMYRLRRKAKRGRRAMSEIREASAEQWERALLKQTPGAQGRRLHDRYMQKGGWKWQGVLLTEEEKRTLRLAVAIQADGTRTNGYQYDICVWKERKVQALQEMGLEPVQQSRGRWRVRVPVDTVSRWLDETKNFRADAILAMRVDGLRFFVREVMQWDGDSTREATYIQHEARRQSVDVVQAAACLAGHGTSLYVNPKRDDVTVNVHRYPIKGFGWQEPVRVRNEDGMVYCVTVPSGMFLCRNDQGKVLVTGNSPKKYHFDLRAAKEAHAAGEQPPPGTCFTFNFRDCITCPPDCYILGFDLSQAELRAVAGEAQELTLLEAFANGDDVHKVTASVMLGVPLEDIDSDRRDVGKMLNFALLYGLSVKGLADRLAIPIEEAQVLMDKYFAGMPAIAAYMAKQVRHGKQHGYVMSKFGRRLPIWEYESTNPWIYSKGDRACVNYPIQGAATGDYMKIAMVRVTAAIKQAGLADKIKLVMNIHDALEFYVHRSVDPQQAIDLLKPAVVFEVPGWPQMRADWHIAKRWGSPTELSFAEDGSLMVNGQPLERDPSTQIEQTEDGDTVEVLPEVNIDVLRAAASGPAKTVVISLTEMPVSANWLAFVGLAKDIPGSNELRVRTPEGILTLPFTCGLDLSHLGTVARLLPGASMRYESHAAPAQLVHGLTL